MSSPPRIWLSCGEPAGIGPDLVVQLAASKSPPAAVTVIGDPTVLSERATALDIPLRLRLCDAIGNRRVCAPGELAVLPIRFPHPVRPGELDPGNAAVVLEGIREATAACLEQRAEAMVTGPVSKAAIATAGFQFSGHTEFVAGLCGVPLPVMLLVAGSFRVALATTHLPLRAVPEAITKDRVMSVTRLLHAGLRDQFAIESPRVLVCGLNPHAGESGLLGREEIDQIIPAVEALRTEGLRVTGPVPADTAFTPQLLADCDAVLAMYHDQGLPVLKYVGFGHAVNVTLGLPIVRTSVDHGTALELAGRGGADPGSLRSAIHLAAELSRHHGAVDGDKVQSG